MLQAYQFFRIFLQPAGLIWHYINTKMVHAEIQNDLHFVILLEQPVKLSPFQFTILDKKLAW